MARLSLHLSKCHIVGYLMLWLIWSPMYKKYSIILDNTLRRVTRMVNIAYEERLRFEYLPQWSWLLETKLSPSVNTFNSRLKKASAPTWMEIPSSELRPHSTANNAQLGISKLMAWQLIPTRCILPTTDLFKNTYLKFTLNKQESRTTSIQKLKGL